MAVEKQKPEMNEIAVAGDMDMFQGFLNIIENPDKVLNLECGGDITVYDDIGRDPRISSNLGTRARAVVGKEWLVVPFSQEAIDIKVADYVQKVFLDFPFDRARRPVLRGGSLKGFAVSEIMWDHSEGDTFIYDMRYRHQRRFHYDKEGQLFLKTMEHPMGMNVTIRDGLPLKKFQSVTFGDEAETPYGCGLGRELYWPWWFKKNGIRLWLMFCDKFAAPTVKGEYDPGATPEDQAKLLSAAHAVHSNSAVIYPKGMSLGLIEAARSGAITTYRELTEFMNEESTICILGQTATTTGTAGKMGNEDAQENVKDDIIKADADALCEHYNAREGVIRWLVDYQFPGHGRYPKIWIDCERGEDKKTLAERDDKLSSAMARSNKRLTTGYFVRVHGLEEDDIEEIPKENTPPAPKAPEPGTVSFADPAGSETFPDQVVVDALLGLVTPETLQKQMGPILAPIITALQKSGNTEEAMQGIVDAYPDMDGTALEKLLTNLIFISEIMGRLDAGN
ncbi:MAG: hypothetical protein A2075_12165 [Geobacteraceae bacterium GWC2_58_44]|nr:MAG: hypothetical protein A2075_12165 [Geobacteraceae bacterium GWC2_58_44]HBG06317.1 hypothetical protein [Geobacter sp.]